MGSVAISAQALNCNICNGSICNLPENGMAAGHQALPIRRQSAGPIGQGHGKRQARRLVSENVLPTGGYSTASGNLHKGRCRRCVSLTHHPPSFGGPRAVPVKAPAAGGGLATATPRRI